MADPGDTSVSFHRSTELVNGLWATEILDLAR